MSNPRTRTLRKLLVFAVLSIAGNLLASLLLLALAVAHGLSLESLYTAMSSGDIQLPVAVLRGALWIQAFALFILPALLYAWIYHRTALVTYFRMRRFPGLWTILVATVILLAGYPLVQLAYEVNSLLPLSGWMREMEDSATDILQQVLAMDSAVDLIHAMMLVAVLPALGEELVFRGILQRELGVLIGSPVLGIWAAAIIFSAIHLQFAGFLPRLALGLILGYLYYWTQNLWAPILMHFLNNGFQVGILYMTGTDLSQPGETTGVTVWSIILSVIVLYAGSEYLKRARHV